MIELLLPFCLAILGLISVISRKTLLGLLVGIQLIFFGASSLFVFTGAAVEHQSKAAVFALVILLTGASQLVAGYAVLGRFLGKKKDIEVEQWSKLKH